MGGKRKAGGLELVTAYLEIITEYLADEHDLQPLTAQKCSDIERERKAGDKRYYAHVDCTEGVVCFATDVGKLAPRKQAGLVLHEIGHLLDDLYDTQPSPDEIEKAQEIYPAGRVMEEARANQAIADALDIEIDYGRDRVQQISAKELTWLENQ